MLKWTSRRDHHDPKTSIINFQSTETLSNTPARQKTKRRRSSTARRTSTQKRCSLDALEADKENQFHSTPIKNTSIEAFSPFRDVSNLTPKKTLHNTPKFKIKKKKECLENHVEPRVSDSSNYFRPFEAVDSHIESILAEDLCHCNKPPPNKKTKIESIDDIVEPTDKANLPGFKPKKPLETTVKMSPLVRKFLDLNFTKDNSSFINDMSLDKLVDVLLEKSETNTSMIVNINNKDLEKENNHNETKLENIINAEQERHNMEVNSEASSDSGFKDNSHQLDNNFLCKCNNNTIIQLNSTYNERCVDTTRKRTSAITPEETEDTKRAKLDDSCTLKRQRCVRRRKVEHLKKKLSNIESQTVSPFWSTQKQFVWSSDDESFHVESTPLRGCYLENKDILSKNDVNKTIRKCLQFNESSSFADSTVRSAVEDVRGSLDLRIFANGDWIYVNVIRCHDLYRGDGETINAYVKVAISDRLLSSRSKKKNAVLQRTPVQSNNSRPIFNHTFKFSKLPADTRKRIHLEIWHRDRNNMSSDFLGCMSFDVQDAYNNKIIEGSYRLLPQSEGRLTHLLSINDLMEPDQVSMGENNQDDSVIEEILSLDGVETELKRSTNKQILSEQQKYADEHLFLRYLELDPIEGPDAVPAAMQRRATGNKFGRTPFTHTKRLTRPAKSGFGFSVVWTHPPRIERVEKGLPAEKAGILPGDYIIFVDKHNVVMTPEIDILNLIRSYGSQLTLEIFRRNPSRNGSVPSVNQKSTTIVTPSSIRTDSNVNIPSSATAATAATALRRPSTVCSTNTASVDYRRRKLNLPQVTFSSEKPITNPEESRKRTIYQLIGKEQQYATALQFAVTRFVSALAERKDLITPAEHKTLFQNSEEILRITEDILDHLVHEDGEMDTNMLTKIYRCKLREINTAYKKYCAGIKKADCVLADKMKNCNSDFVRFVQCPTIPRRRPDLTSFIHKPLEHYREVLKILMGIQGHTPPKHEDFPVINQIVHEMQVTYREITSEGGLMEPCGEGRPLLSVQDLENRLVFTKCKPFVLNKPGRQWIFGGDLSRVEGRNVRQYWTLLFSDLLLFAKASRDRVLFITEDPLPLCHITDMYFNIRKKDTEFRISINPDAKNDQATSPTIHCGPDLSRTPKKNSSKKTVILRAPSTELKAVWQNLLQRQIFQINSGTDNSALSSPIESPMDLVPINSSVGTLQSMETNSFRRQPSQTLDNDCRRNNNRNDDVKKQLETLIEHKCKQMGKSSFNGKCNAIHLEQWMKGQLDGADPGSPVVEQIDEEWTEEMLRRRSEELQLIDHKGNMTQDSKIGCEELVISDHDEQSPSKSTTTESQVTVRSSPIVPETVPVCRQCHKNCLSNVLANSNKQEHHQDCSVNQTNNNPISSTGSTETNNIKEDDNDWQTFLLLGVCANPVANLIKYDPFKAPQTPENQDKSTSCMCIANGNCNKSMLNKFDQDISPDDSPQTEEPPYHSLSSSAQTLRRYGTVASLERCGSEHDNGTENHYSSEESDIEDDDYLGIDNEAFNHSSIMSWTARASSYVAEKMSFFEKLGEDYRSGGGFFDRYLKSSDGQVNGEDPQEEETSGATSGEEVWGTPTSGGELDSPNSPNYDGKLSPNNGSYCSDNPDDTEIMMDELLMAPPITGAVLRGLLPRRTLEPLIEEDFSDSTSSSSSSDPISPQSNSSEQDSRSGSAADTSSRDVVERARNERIIVEPKRSSSSSSSTSPEENAQHSSRASICHTTTSQSLVSSEWEEAQQRVCENGEGCCIEVSDLQTAATMPRSESYRKIVEAAEDAISTTMEPDSNRMIAASSSDTVLLFDRFRPAARFVNIERVPRTRSIRIFEFFNVRRTERRIYERYPENRHLMKTFSQENEKSDPDYSPSKIPVKDNKDNRNGRFWRQLSRRRTIDKTTNAA